MTITPSKEPLIEKEWIKKGTHISCVGADMPDKQEIDPQILKIAKVYVDDLEHCIKSGEIEKAIKKRYNNCQKYLWYCRRSNYR
ncbi:hypothetical protein [Mammaliicoccus lentus]|uniref:hypothetical protein n=1 Tax=Mammaliicoccus lentus TaxID=42858 RepID=UPI002155FBDE|nr:hypothetical protein [Mammaliicoccus lentus]